MRTRRGPRAAALAAAVVAAATGLSAGASRGEEIAEHEHKGGDGNGMLMLTRGGYVLTRMPPFDPHLSTGAQRRRARRLLARTRNVARSLFPSFATARRRGYLGDPNRDFFWKWMGDHYVKAPRRPRLLHLNKPSYLRDGHLLDPRRPESLVYLRRRSGWKLVAFMYRAKTGPVPTPGGLLTRWHLHGGCADPGRVPRSSISVRDRRCPKGEVLHYGRTAMMHVWLGRTLRVGFSMSPPHALVPKLDGH